MSRMIIFISHRDKEALVRMAECEYRDPRLMAGWLIRQALELAGYLNSPTPTPTPQEAHHVTNR